MKIELNVTLYKKIINYFFEAVVLFLTQKIPGHKTLISNFD